MSNMHKIQQCLNCTSMTCSGNYPRCEGMKKSKRYQKTKLRKLGYGNAVILIGLLVKMGLSCNEIIELCESNRGSITNGISRAVEKGIITAQEAEESKLKEKTA